ncbi:shikimate dehydrogenase [candidate division KSB1 bacterium]|nr:shikimate dehydrogenase [candidate division KSB1 bacterium]
MLDSRTKIFGIIGDPVVHSLSPVMQNYFMKMFKINGVYCAFRIHSNDLETCLKGAPIMGFVGLNVTLPHKYAAAQTATFSSPEVRLLQVANTLQFKQDGIHAFTTDHYGFIASVGEHRARFSGAQVLMFGAGGSARSVAFALSQLGISALTIANRNESKAVELARFCQQNLAMTNVAAISINHPNLSHFIDQATILINTTSLGMYPIINEAPVALFTSIGKKHFVYDLIYNPLMTRFMYEAEKRGATVKNGLDMLIYQGLASLNIWSYEDFRLDINSFNELKSLLYRELK